MNNEKTKIFYDCGELGWSMVIAAHVNLLLKDYDRKLAVCTYDERKCLYNGLDVEIVDIPENLMSFLDAVDRDGTHLYNHVTKERIGHEVLTPVFEEYFANDYDVAKPKDYRYAEITRILPYKYVPTKEALERVQEKFEDQDDIIIILPRARNGKFGKRNLPLDFYKDLTVALEKKLPKNPILWFGSQKEAYSDPDVEYSEFVNQNDKDKLADLIALCSLGKVKLAVGSQSAPPKIAAIMGVKVFMCGHEKERHMVTDNWFKAPVGFFEVPIINDAYNMSKSTISNCIKEIIAFANA
jgi:hypothetical protein